MGINEAMVAGAVISGAYFGDKMSPLSDTTNLAPAMAGTDLFSHIRYMTLTTIPSILIALIAFLILGFTINTGQGTEDSNAMLNAIKTTFNITPWLFLVPALVIFLIAKRVDALIAILIGAIGGAIFILIFQPQLVGSIATLGTTPFAQSYEVGMRAMYGEITLETSNPLLTELTSTSGMQGMMGTIWLILSAMIFGGAMEGAGFLNIITRNIMIFAKTTFRLVFSTVSTCLFLNITASDQYLAIVVPGRMFKSLYDEKDLAPENLSRTLEDSGTVTSVLVPWNTCGAYQSGVLGVATGEYFIYAFFNLISPLMTLIYSYFGIKIKTKTLDNTAA
jgi:NhaC family Na+:H+ antiporter